MVKNEATEGAKRIIAEVDAIQDSGTRLLRQQHTDYVLSRALIKANAESEMLSTIVPIGWQQTLKDWQEAVAVWRVRAEKAEARVVLQTKALRYCKIAAEGVIHNIGPSPFALFVCERTTTALAGQDALEELRKINDEAAEKAEREHLNFRQDANS